MKIPTLILSGSLAVALAAPALARDTNKIVLQPWQEKVAAPRADPAAAQAGSRDLAPAETALGKLPGNLEDDDATDVRSLTAQVEARIETARTRARVAALKEEVAALKAQNTGRVAQAEATAQVAEADAAAAKARADALAQQLRGYQMRQSAEGTTLVLQDVLFSTGSAALQEGAALRLQPLVNYLRGNPNVQVRIDGHTDSQGSDATNQSLSARRAESVRQAIASAGIDAARISAVGHGESQPVASNGNAAGRQQNRRVEITLVGQKIPA